MTTTNDLVLMQMEKKLSLNRGVTFVFESINLIAAKRMQWFWFWLIWNIRRRGKTAKQKTEEKNQKKKNKLNLPLKKILTFIQLSQANYDWSRIFKLLHIK